MGIGGSQGKIALEKVKGNGRWWGVKGKSPGVETTQVLSVRGGHRKGRIKVWGIDQKPQQDWGGSII